MLCSERRMCLCVTLRKTLTTYTQKNEDAQIERTQKRRQDKGDKLQLIGIDPQHFEQELTSKNH